MKAVSILVVLILCVSALSSIQVKAADEGTKPMLDFGNGRHVPTLENGVELKRRQTARRFLQDVILRQECTPPGEHNECITLRFREGTIYRMVPNARDEGWIDEIAQMNTIDEGWP